MRRNRLIPPLWWWVAFAFGILFFIGLGAIGGGCCAWPISGLEKSDLKLIKYWQDSNRYQDTANNTY